MKEIEYKSEKTLITPKCSVLETSYKDGVDCSWTGKTMVLRSHSYLYHLNLIWEFDWRELKGQGVDRLIGWLVLKPTASADFAEHKIDVEWTQGTEKIVKKLPVRYNNTYATFEYYLTALKKTENAISQIEHSKIPFETMFKASDTNDTCLIVEGRRIYVNKALLSYHSELFCELFLTAREMDGIPVEEVSYEDFRLLISTIKHKQVVPDDDNAEKLLKLADRFLMPSVTRLVECHLLEHSRLGNAKLTLIADAYGFKDLLEKCIRSMDNVEKAKKLKNSEEFQKLSEATKARVSKRILQLS